jgi:hypothetical protein
MHMSGRFRVEDRDVRTKFSSPAEITLSRGSLGLVPMVVGRWAGLLGCWAWDAVAELLVVESINPTLVKGDN